MVVQFWKNHKKELPGYSRVAFGLLGMLPGAGGLECDIGGVGDIIGSKRGSLDPGLVEVNLMLRVNKSLQETETIKVPRLGDKWKEHIPVRPSYPEDYFEGEEEEDEHNKDEEEQEEEEEEKEEEDDDDDDD